jgi:hypothetical protein
MNNHDRLNLEFLLTSSPATLKDWYDKMGTDDIQYAMQIMARYSEELTLRQQFTDAENTDIDVLEANDYLSKFRLNK